MAIDVGVGHPKRGNEVLGGGPLEMGTQMDFLKRAGNISLEDHSQRYCNNRGQEALSLCERYLNDDDYQVLFRIQDYTTLLEHLKTQHFNAGDNATSEVWPIINPLKGFTQFLSFAVEDPKLNPSAVWGILDLVVQAADQTQTLFPRILGLLRDLARQLECFERYDTEMAPKYKVPEEVIDIYVHMIEFWLVLLPSLRRNRQSAMEKVIWPELQQSYSTIIGKIQQRLTQVEGKIHSFGLSKHSEQDLFRQTQTEVLNELDKLKMQTGTNIVVAEVDSVFPCNNIRYPKNPLFYGRHKELDKIRESLHSPARPGFQSFALYGTGGIGKTQCAIAYAYEQVIRGTQAVLWVDCETGLSIARSFAIIAEMLRLEGRVEGENSDQNRIAVMKWLRRTNVSWFMVMDNVEDVDLVRSSWPNTLHGAVLVTSRDEIVCIDPAAGGLDVSIFTEEEGAELILNIVGRDTYSNDEKVAARQLCIEVGGLALALVTLASQIKLRQKSCTEFLNFYKKHPSNLHKQRRGLEMYYNKSLDTCWQTAFSYLSPDAFQLLSIVSFIAPDSIPEQLFMVDPSIPLPDDLKFCHDLWSTEDALGELFKTSLIRKNHDTKLMSIHRVIQHEFRSNMTFEQRHTCFRYTSTLLEIGFPKHRNGLSLRNHWDQCKLYVQHILILCNRWQEDKFRENKVGEFKPFIDMSASCGWYLMESGAVPECCELMVTALDVCVDKESVDYSNLTNQAGCNEVEIPRPPKAREYITTSLKIRQKLLPPNSIEIANGYNNMGNVILQEGYPGAAEEAVRLLTLAVEIDFQNPYDEYKLIQHIRNFNLAKSHWLLGNLEDAFKCAETGRKYAIDTFGPECHFEGTADFLCGNVRFDQKRYHEAIEYWTRAERIFGKENEIHPSTTAAQMKLAMAALELNETKKAIAILEKTILICRLNESTKGDQGDSGRMRWRLGIALEKDGQLEEAKKQKNIAREIRREFQGARFYELPDDTMSYDLMVYVDFW